MQHFSLILSIDVAISLILRYMYGPLSFIITVTFIGETGFEVILWARLDYIIIQIVHLIHKKNQYRLPPAKHPQNNYYIIIVVMQTTVL